MRTPLRLLRAQADDLPGARPRLSSKEREQQDRIVASATALMAHFGRPSLSFHGFATAIRMAPATLRRHFPDLDTLLADILYRHLLAISAAIGEPLKLPATASIAQRRTARRAAYIAVTRGPLNGPTHAHVLLIRDRHVLPPDLAEPIEDLRLQIGEMLAPGNAEAALALLDTSLPAIRIEAMLAGGVPPKVAVPAAPHPPPHMIAAASAVPLPRARAGPS